MNHFLAKFSIAIVFFGVSLITACFCDAAFAKDNTTINIGIYAPFSNESAFIGRQMLGAMEIARDQLKSPINYEFYTLDTMKNNADAARILKKFIDTHHINILLSEGAESGALVAPLAKKNNIIHFCLTKDSVIADGQNNFLAQSPNHQQAMVLTKTMKPEFIAQFKQEYFSYPVTEAGYAFDIFHLLHHSVVLAMKTKPNFSSQIIATHLLALESGTGVMGTFKLDKKGLSYKKQQILTA